MDNTPQLTVKTNIEPVPKRQKNKCLMCKKRVGLMGFVCKCGNLYCNEHRYPDCHNCEHDHKHQLREKLIRENPVIVSDKLQQRV